MIYKTDYLLDRPYISLSLSLSLSLSISLPRVRLFPQHTRTGGRG